jgi:hypothetical protein
MEVVPRRRIDRLIALILQCTICLDLSTICSGKVVLAKQGLVTPAQQ